MINVNRGYKNLKYSKSIYMSYLEDFNTNLEHLLLSIDEYYKKTLYTFPLEGDVYIKQFLTNCIDKGYDISTKNEIIFSEDSIILNGVDFNRLWNDDNIEDEHRENIWKYIHTLYVYAIQYKTDKSAKTILEEYKHIDLNNVEEEIKTFIHIIDSFTNNIETDATIDNIDLGDMDKNVKDTEDTPFHMPDLFGGTIGELAKEIADDIDPSTLQLDDPNTLLQNLMSGNLDNDTSGMKDLISSITGKIQTKLSSGELDQDALFKEASTMMGQFGTASGSSQDPFAGMFNTMGASNVNTNELFKNISASMGNLPKEDRNKQSDRLKLEQQREHLRQKLKEKKQLLELELKNAESTTTNRVVKQSKKKRKRKKKIQE